MKKNFLIFLCTMLIYAVVDIIYQFAFGMQVMDTLYTNAGIRDVISSAPNYAWTILLFFIIISLALTVLVIKPAIAKRSVRLAFWHGCLLGVTAYSTLAFVFLWSIVGYPVLAALEVIFEGLLFSPISASLTTWLFLRKER